MELNECIKGRRSIRAYTAEPVSKEQINAILEAGTWAPTAMNRQPWNFIIIEDKKLLKLISDETKVLVKQMMPPLAENFCRRSGYCLLQCTRDHISLHREG